MGSATARQVLAGQSSSMATRTRPLDVDVTPRIHPQLLATDRLLDADDVLDLAWPNRHFFRDEGPLVDRDVLRADRQAEGQGVAHLLWLGLQWEGPPGQLWDGEAQGAPARSVRLHPVTHQSGA